MQLRICFCSGLHCTCVKSWRGSPRGPRCHHRPLPAAGRSLAPVRTLGADCGMGAATPLQPHLCLTSTRWRIRPWSSWAGSCHSSWSSSSEPRNHVPREENDEAPRSPLCYKHGEFYRRSRWPAGMERRRSSWSRLCGPEECKVLKPFCDRDVCSLTRWRKMQRYSPSNRKTEEVGSILKQLMGSCWLSGVGLSNVSFKGTNRQNLLLRVCPGHFYSTSGFSTAGLFPQLLSVMWRLVTQCLYWSS